MGDTAGDSTMVRSSKTEVILKIMMCIDHSVNSNVLMEETVISQINSYKVYQVMNSGNSVTAHLMQSGMLLGSHELKMCL